MGETTRPELLTVDHALALDAETITELCRRHLGPDQHRMMLLLGFDTMLDTYAQGVHNLDAGGRRVLDLSGGFGALAMGHNHPRLVAARRKFAEQRRREVAFPSHYAAALATNLARIAPGDLNVVHLCGTGSDAVQTALTLARRAQGPRRPGVVYAAQPPRSGLPRSLRHRWPLRHFGGRLQVPYGDVKALVRALRSHQIGTVVLETVQGRAGVVAPPPGYLRQVRELCDQHGVLWIANEVHCGIGRTGRFFAFEHGGVVPDLVTLEKSLAGGKLALGAVIARRPVHRRACPDAASAMALGASIFSGTGEACCLALEALAVLYDENLISNAERTGGYLLRRLEGLRICYPELVLDVRGAGLMVGLRLAGPLRGGLAGVVGGLLLAEHGILVACSEHDRDVLRLEPPLNIAPEHVDEFVDALEELLSRGPRRLAQDHLRVARGRWPGPAALGSMPVTTRR